MAPWPSSQQRDKTGYINENHHISHYYHEFQTDNILGFTPEPESILACLLAAHSSILSLGIPAATALAIPPRFSTYQIKIETYI